MCNEKAHFFAKNISIFRRVVHVVHIFKLSWPSLVSLYAVLEWLPGRGRLGWCGSSVLGLAAVGCITAGAHVAHLARLVVVFGLIPAELKKYYIFLLFSRLFY